MPMACSTELADIDDQLVGWGLKIVETGAEHAGWDVHHIHHPPQPGDSATYLVDRPDVWLVSLPYAGNLRYIREFFEQTARDEIRRSERDTDTVYIIGGHAVVNPNPLLEAFDAAFVGEADDVIDDIMEAAPDMKALSECPGIITEPGDEVEFQLAPDLSKRNFYKATYNSDNDVGETLYLEIARGCKVGCRFCELGWAYGQNYEERPREETEKLIEQAMEAGFDRDQIVLSAPHTDGVDYFHDMIEEGEYQPRWRSTTVYRYLDEAESEPSGKRGRIRFGVEGVTERLRVLVGKRISNADILEAMNKAVREGYRMMRIFLIGGLPSETRQDRHRIQEIMELFPKVKNLRHWQAVDIKVTGLSPQPFTPFQRFGVDKAIRALRYYRKAKRARESEQPYWRQVMVDRHTTEADVIKRMEYGELVAYLEARAAHGDPEDQSPNRRWQQTRKIARAAGIDYDGRVRSTINDVPWSNVEHPEQARLDKAESNTIDAVARHQDSDFRDKLEARL